MAQERDAILEAFREGRQAIDDFGLRRTYVYVRTRRWYTGTTPPWAPSSGAGVGLPVDTTTQILPTPRVRSLSERFIAGSGGRFASGDLRIDKITPRHEPSTGTELWPFTRATTARGEERHVLLVDRDGTPWHLREGGDRVLTPGPFDVATAVACVNALRAAYATHFADTEAHAVADATALPGTDATTQGEAITLANALRAAWGTHRTNLAAHPEADASPVLAPVAATAQSLLELAHDLLRVFNEHVARGEVKECTVVQAHADRAFTLELIVRPTRRTP